jgi:hypothetical protein
MERQKTTRGYVKWKPSPKATQKLTLAFSYLLGYIKGTDVPSQANR